MDAHKSGFVNILGNSNVGKSTLMNQLMGSKLSIVTEKMQTTRHRIKGILSTEEFQIVFSDTPGIITPSYRLQKHMMSFVKTAIEDADVILYVTDVKESLAKNMEYLNKIKKSGIPVIAVLNKVDQAEQKRVETLLSKLSEILPEAKIAPISALHNFNIEYILQLILERLPNTPPYYSKDDLTDKSLRFFAEEFIREKMLLTYDKEVPYSVQVIVEEFKESKKAFTIKATIYCERESQKRIIIGHEGKNLTKIGKLSREEIANFVGKYVHLNLFVKVQKNWREDDKALANFGYVDE